MFPEYADDVDDNDAGDNNEDNEDVDNDILQSSLSSLQNGPSDSIDINCHSGC